MYIKPWGPKSVYTAIPGRRVRAGASGGLVVNLVTIKTEFTSWRPTEWAFLEPKLPCRKPLAFVRTTRRKSTRAETTELFLR